MQSTSKGWLRFIAVFAVLTLILVACGDGAEDTTTTAAPGETTTTADSGSGDTTTTEAMAPRKLNRGPVSTPPGPRLHTFRQSA